MKEIRKQVLKYIEDYWQEITFSMSDDEGVKIGLPNPFISPNHDIFKKDLFYWDSYAHMLAMIERGEVELCKGIVDNFVYLFERFNIVPSRNRYFNTGISQPPFLTSMARMVFSQTNDREWFNKVMLVAERELLDYWMDDKRAERHLVYKNLSRYCDHYIIDDLAVHESGWDMTSRFRNVCLDMLPVDLNSLLYMYERDLQFFFTMLGHGELAGAYSTAVEKRRQTMMQLMYDGEVGYFFDYDFVKEQRDDFITVAGIFPLWAKISYPDPAARAKDFLLDNLEQKYGIVNTQKEGCCMPQRQHDWPNGWPLIHWIIVEGLTKYGFVEDALRIAQKYVDLVEAVFAEDGYIHEKYNVVDGGPGEAGAYMHQVGFGWSNAIYLKMISFLDNHN